MPIKASVSSLDNFLGSRLGPASSLSAWPVNAALDIDTGNDGQQSDLNGWLQATQPKSALEAAER